MLVQALALFAVVVAVQVVLVGKVADFMTGTLVRAPDGNRDIPRLGKSKTA
jgi:hypothetical protein